MKKLLVVVGPTGTGKTDLAVEVAKKFDGEIVSADSRQIYRYMDIGTGKISENRSSGKNKNYWLVNSIPIHLYDIIDPDKTFSVVEYQQRAYDIIHKIQSKNKLPILVGGSGLYVRSVVQGLKFPQVEPDKKFRAQLEKKSLAHLLEELERVDPKMYRKIDKSNPRRVIRVLEVFHKTGKPMSTLAKRYKPDFDIFQLGLTATREVLYENADKRVERWVDLGFVDEVKSLLKKYDQGLTSLSSLGYRQIASFIQKNITLEDAIRKIKFDHHGYIRRQLTWFKNEPGINWLDITKPNLKLKTIRLVDKWMME